MTRDELSRPTVLLVIGAYLLAALPHMAGMPPWLIALILATALWRGAVSFLDLRRPGWVIRAIATFGGLGLVVLHFGTLWGRRAATVLLCVMVAAKLSEMFRLRDARVVAALGYFLIATQFLFSQGLLMFGYLLLGCWLVTAALARIQRDEDGPGQELDAVRTLAPALRGGVALLLLAAPFAVALFFLFPRLASPLWGVPEEALDGRTGLSDRMSPGDIVDLYVDDSPAFRAEFDGPPPERRRLYWRGPVLWRFDGRTWSRLAYEVRDRTPRPRPSPQAVAYRVQLEPSERRWMFALDYPVRAPQDATMTPDFELLHERPITSLLAYDMISEPDFIDSPALGSVERRLALFLPVGSNPRTAARAAELRREHVDDRALIQAVLDWFNQDDFYYSLETAPLGRHSADEFLFDLRIGYCEYYASAFAILMRHAGIPARIVTGYQGGFWQAADQYLLVRQSDAHAWVEVWLDGQGWSRVDPTAAVSPTRVMEGARSALGDQPRWFGSEWLYSLRNQYDRFHRIWNEWVLTFDQQRQETLLQRIGLGDLGPGLRAAVLIAAAAVALVPLALLLQFMLYAPREPDPLARRWSRIRRRLARAGVPVGPGQTPLELASASATHLANIGELERLARDYAALRYGPESGRGEREEVARRMSAWKPVTVN